MPGTPRELDNFIGGEYVDAGQDCTAATRVLVAPGIHDDFVAALAQYARIHVVVGLADNADALLGPVNNADQLAHVTGMLDRTPDHADIAAGGHRMSGRGRVLPATDGSLRSDSGRRDESQGDLRAGHLGTTYRRRTRRDQSSRRCAVRAGVIGVDPRLRPGRAGQQGARLRVCVNQHPHPGGGRVPYGGFKHSGYGKDLSKYGFEDFTRVKDVMANINS